MATNEIKLVTGSTQASFFGCQERQALNWEIVYVAISRQLYEIVVETQAVVGSVSAFRTAFFRFIEGKNKHFGNTDLFVSKRVKHRQQRACQHL